jgi:hypothetical protein
MAVLVIIPSDEMRERATALIGEMRCLRARNCEDGLRLAEYYAYRDVIIWSPPGLDAEVLQTIIRLQRARRDARIFVITAVRSKAARLGYCEGAKVDGFALESELSRVVEDMLTLPAIVERSQQPTLSAAVSSTPAARSH